MAYDDPDLKDYRQEFADDTAEWQTIRDERKIDMRYVAGDPWEPKDRQMRESAGRPCIATDELSQYTNQVVNEVRANKRAVKFSPVGNGANDDTAEFYADKWREIEYRSRAQVAYTRAFSDMVEGSYGFVRVNIRYPHARAVNLEIWVDPVHDPDLITPDPFAQMPDLSDMKRCTVREPWRLEDFNRTYPKSKVEGRALASLMADAPTWFSSDVVWLAERWKVKTTKRKLLFIEPSPQLMPASTLGLSQPQSAKPELFGVFENEFQPGMGKVVKEEMRDDPKVIQCITNGVETLDETPWHGKYIPIVACLGKVIYVDEGVGGRRKILSMVRLARSPYMAYCFYRTCEIENVGMTTKNPYWAYKGQLDNAQMVEIQKSLHEPVAVLLANPTTPDTGQQVLPLPVRNVSEPAIQALSMGAEEMRRAIQAAMGQSPLPTSAQRRNEKSGIALKQIEEAGQRGSFHFTDAYVTMLEGVGRIGEDLMDKVHDTAREIGIRKANDEAESIRVNDPNDPKSISTKGDHLVTVSTGPSFESEREAASDFADTLANISPEIFGLLGPLIVKLKNLGPVGDEMIELLEAMQPPPVQELRKSKKQGEQADPAQTMQELQQAKAKLQELEGIAQQMKQALDAESAKQQATVEKTKAEAAVKMQIAQMEAELKIQIARMDNAARIRVAEIAAETKGASDAAAHAMEHEKLATGQAIEVGEAEASRQHEAAMAAIGHQQALEQGEQGLQGEMGLAEQQAALQPVEPSEGAEA